MTEQPTRSWDPSYERKAVILLALGFGLVGLDRTIIAPLFPVIAEDLGLSYGALGSIAGVLAIFWGIFAMIMGGLSDKVGRRKVLIPSVVAFSLLAGLTGLANGLIFLLLVRATMGIFEGAFTPTSIAATAEASKPSRRGLNLGIQQSAFSHRPGRDLGRGRLADRGRLRSAGLRHSVHPLRGAGRAGSGLRHLVLPQGDRPDQGRARGRMRPARRRAAGARTPAVLVRQPPSFVAAGHAAQAPRGATCPSQVARLVPLPRVAPKRTGSGTQSKLGGLHER